MSKSIVYKERTINSIGYDDADMLFTFEGEAIPSISAPVEYARALYSEIFAQLSSLRIAQYEASIELFRKYGSAI